MPDPEVQPPSSAEIKPNPRENETETTQAIPAGQPELPGIAAKTTSSTTQLPAPTPAVQEPAPFHRWVDTINKLFQIAAIVFAGAWAIFVFLQTIAPTLELKFPFDSEIHWTKIPKTDLCQARIEFTVKNEGQIPFEITDVTLKGSIVELNQEVLSMPSANEPFFLDPLANLQPEARPPFPLANSALTRDLRGHYPAGSHDTASVNYVFKRPKNKNAIVAVQADASGWMPSSLLPWAQHKDVTNYTYAVDQVCGGTWDENLRSRPETEEKPKSLSNK